MSCAVHQLLEDNACLLPTPQMMADLQSLACALLESLNDKNLALSHQRKTNKYAYLLSECVVFVSIVWSVWTVGPAAHPSNYYLKWAFHVPDVFRSLNSLPSLERYQLPQHNMFLHARMSQLKRLLFAVAAVLILNYFSNWQLVSSRHVRLFVISMQQ